MAQNQSANVGRRWICRFAFAQSLNKDRHRNVGLTACQLARVKADHTSLVVKADIASAQLAAVSATAVTLSSATGATKLPFSQVTLNQYTNTRPTTGSCADFISPRQAHNVLRFDDRRLYTTRPRRRTQRRGHPKPLGQPPGSKIQSHTGHQSSSPRWRPKKCRS